jgi:hypothetical protein
LALAPFNVEFTIAEPCPAKTSFGGGLVSPPPMDVYENTPAGEMRRAFAAGTFIVKGDPIKMAQAMIDSVDRSPAPKRLALGRGTYTSIRAALVEPARRPRLPERHCVLDRHRCLTPSFVTHGKGTARAGVSVLCMEAQ